MVVLRWLLSTLILDSKKESVFILLDNELFLLFFNNRIIYFSLGILIFLIITSLFNTLPSKISTNSLFINWYLFSNRFFKSLIVSRLLISIEYTFLSMVLIVKLTII